MYMYCRVQTYVLLVFYFFLNKWDFRKAKYTVRQKQHKKRSDRRYKFVNEKLFVSGTKFADGLFKQGGLTTSHLTNIPRS